MSIKNHPILTLTTDYGIKDYYVGSLKGQLLHSLPQATIVDISHLVPPHNIVKAAYQLKNAYASFPKETVHLVDVNVHQQTKIPLLLTKQRDHYFLLPDNGILSLVFDTLSENVFRIPKLTNTYPELLTLYGKTVQQLHQGVSMENLGELTNDIQRRLTLQPVLTASQIRGSVIHIDHYENVIVNIHQTLFEQVGRDRPFQLFFKRHNPIHHLSENYSDCEVGDVLCRFNTAGYLEIAISMGKAASLLGLHEDDMVQVDFRNG